MGEEKKIAPLDRIKCPKCGKLIPITETLQNQLTENMRKEMKEKMARQEEVFANREKELQEREEKLATVGKQIEKQVQTQLKKERLKLQQEAQERAEETLGVEIKDLHEQVKEKEEKLKEAQEKELKIRKRERKIEEAQKSLELEMERKLDKERRKIEEEITKRIDEEHDLKDLEKDKQINDMKKRIEELKRKAEQGSQQAQGEVFEIALEDLLKENFPFDDIEPIPKGTPGADVLQKIYTRSGNRCGSILWESKRTKNWSNKWIPKVKKDQREVQADIAVIVSENLPTDIQNFALKDGVWVTDYKLTRGLAVALRQNLAHAAAIKQASLGKNEKTERLWKYLIGPQFRQRVEAMVEGIKNLQEGLETEKRTCNRIWAQREKQIQQVIGNTAGLYGDMQGLIGPSMQSIPALEPGKEVEGKGGEEEYEEKPAS